SRLQGIPGQRAAAQAGGARRDRHALPARASWRGNHRRGYRRSAFGRARSGREPPACSESGDGLAGAPGGARAYCIDSLDFAEAPVATEKIKKLVLAYSGGLDTSVMLRWIKDEFGCEVIAYCADVGQAEETEGLEAKALATGASKFYLADLREEFARDFVFPMMRANAIYEGYYLLGTSIARP